MSLVRSSVFVLALLLGLASWPAGAIKQLVVFFLAGDASRLDPVQWTVTAEGLAVVADVAALHAERGGFILVVGGDQNFGSAADALERSLRRAEAVKAALAARGVPADAITATGCGFSRPFMPQPAGVREPMNRYAIMDFFDDQAALAAAAATVCEER